MQIYQHILHTASYFRIFFWIRKVLLMFFVYFSALVTISFLFLYMEFSGTTPLTMDNG